MENAMLDESQAVIKISGRKINNLRYADDTTLMAESEEELKNFLMRVKKESEKVCLKLNIQKTKIKNTRVSHRSLQHYSIQLEHGSNLGAHRQTDGQESSGYTHSGILHSE